MKTTPLFKILPVIFAMLGISHASPIPDFPFIVADGRVEREVPPTNSIVTFTVLEFAKTAEEATDTVQSTLIKVITALKAEGVTEKMIQAHDLDKSAARKRTEESYSDTNVIGYEVSRGVELKLPDLANYSKVLRALMTADHVSKVNSSFDTSDRKEVEAQLTGEACAKARKKADLLAKGAGVKIDSVYAVSDFGFDSVGERFRIRSVLPDFVSSLGGEESSIPLFAPSTITLHANVYILYKLAPPL